jgi:ectoine hydroxylase-related dioxygenase (phytanoyl-CoA dioxygenase family)
MTFPQPDTVWTVPTSAWHLDIPPQIWASITAVRMFAILDDLEPQGGGTLVLAGSHRLAKAYAASSGREPHSRTIKLALGSAHQWLGELWDSDKSTDRDAPSRIRRCMDDGAIVDDVPVIVRELHGAAGDVFLMHSDCFHTVAPNSLKRPRIMLTATPSRDRNSTL